MPPDPYRTLGLDGSASLSEVKRAYRQLAKANHPDRAGEGSLARFLEIQDAYDRIVAGRDGASGRPTAGTRRPWDADPGRADATRRAYGSRTRRPRPAGPRPTRDEAPPAGGSDGGRSEDDGRGAGDGAAGPGPRRRRPPNKATLGSTSYDGADDGPFEPDWGGASWYGTTSGTYWTLNPKEYADPRKHGPEYQARARRAARTRSEQGAPGDGAGPTVAAGGAPEPSPDTTSPRHTTTSWWDATAAAGSPPAGSATREAPGAGSGQRPSGWTTPDARPRRAAGSAATAGADPLLPLFDAGRWLESGRGGVPGRVGRAVVGWAPIALGIGWIAGELTGCGRYSAGCDAAVAPLAWFAQVAILALLLLVPRLGSAATIATLVTLAAAVPGALILSASGTDAADTMAPLALGGLLVVGWVVGIVVGLARELRALRPAAGDPEDAAAGPVS